MRVLLLACAVLLAACSPKTDVQKSDEPPMTVDASGGVAAPEPQAPQPTLDPTELDLSKIALAMRIPSTFRAYGDGAYLQINVTSPRLGVDIAESFPMSITEGHDSVFLASEEKDGFSIWTYATRPEDAERLSALSLELVRLKAEAPGENELSFGAVAPGCWNEAQQSPDSLARTLYIRVMPEEDFQVFVPEQTLTQGDLPGIESFWGACTNANR